MRTPRPLRRGTGALGAGLLALVAWASGSTTPTLSESASEEALSEKTGGQTTVWTSGTSAFSLPLANLEEAEHTRFVIGNSFFKRNWVQAPASTTARDGLGPHFIARSCGGCHLRDGRGEPPAWSKTLGPQPTPTVALLMRLSVPGAAHPHEGVVPEPTYGGQFNNAAVPGVKPEGAVQITDVPLHGRFADGQTYTLHKPLYRLTQLGYGPMARDVMIGPRIAPHLAGLGLLEAIAESDIMANVQQQRALPGPIKGQANRVWDAFASRELIGRFGWKANTASIAHQTAAAFNGDMGITSSVFWREGCTAKQEDCLTASHGGGKRYTAEGHLRASEASAAQPEIDDHTLGQVIFYTSTLAPAARREPSDPQVREGAVLFHAAQCAVCHRPSYTTAQALFPTLSTRKLEGQRIWPYTDLLLHDMGDDLADGRPDFLAGARQWKTPPLWGIGLFKDVNNHQRLLHDGRANGVLEAVLWHAGEAQASKEQVLRMSAAQRQALVRFVNSL